jgi:protocatechuate 3,4-dioxygenase beta subunit
MWKGPVVLVLVVLAFGAGMFVGVGLGKRDRSESAIASTPAATASSKAAPAELLTEPVARVPAPIPSARTEIDRDEKHAPPSPGPSAASLESASNSESGSITVRVVDADGAPVPGATVQKRLEANDSSRRLIGVDDFRSGAKLYADARGLAVLTDVPFGTYRATAEMDGSAPATSELVRVTAADAHPSVQITLTAGGDVVGELRDVHGAVAAAIGLSIHPDTMQPNPPQLTLRQAWTEADGTFAFHQLPAGHYKLYTRAKDEDAKRVPEQNVDVEVLDGQTTHVRFKDISATAVEIAGQILCNGKPLMRAHVMVHWADPSHPTMSRNAESDAEGRFDLTLDEAGEYRFSIAPSSGRHGITTFRETIPQAARHELVLSFGTGTVSGRVLGTGGDPMSGAEVHAMGQRRNDAHEPSGGGAVTTDGTGHYTFADLSSGSYRFIANPPSNGASPFEGQGQSDVVVLEPGAELHDVDLRLIAASAVDGRVQHSDGTPAGKATIECRAARYQRETAADAHGVFVVQGLLPGALWLRAVSEHECSPWTELTLATGEKAHADLVVLPGTIVIVEVEDANGPVATASVSLSDGNERTVHVATVMNGKGHTDPVPPGTYKVTAVRDWRSKKDGPRTESSITLTSEPERVLKLRLP